MEKKKGNPREFGSSLLVNGNAREERKKNRREREREGKMKTKYRERERGGVLGGKGLDGVVKLSEQWWSDEITD